MLKVQLELYQFKKKATEHQFLLRKDEKLKSLKELVEWFKVESIRLATNIERLTEENKT